MSKIDFTMTADYLREHLNYDAETGQFTWKIAGPKRVLGRVAGSLNAKLGYIILRIKGVNHRAHRLAWLYVHGDWPANGLDHIDNDKTNNRISNLRDVPHLWNAQNRLKPRASKLGIRGVRKIGNRYYARLAVDGVEVPLGGFATAAEAHAEYVAATRRLHAGNTA